MRNMVDMTDKEALLLAVDFSPQMGDDETIASENSYGATKVTVHDAAGTDKTTEMIEASSISIDGQTVQARINAAEAGSSYSMEFFAATSSGNYLETRITVRTQG